MSSTNASKTSSKTASASVNPSVTGVDLKEFTLFPKLPVELRSKIWKLAVIPRLVTRTPLFRNAIPAIYHTSREARAESKYEFCRDRYFEGPIINFQEDILFVNEWHGNLLTFLAAVSEAPALFCQVKRLALVLAIDYRFPLPQWVVGSRTFSQEAVNNVFVILEQISPDLQELVYFVRPGPIGATIDDMYQVHEAQGTLLQGEMDKIVSQFQKSQADGKWKSLKVTFMRNETWLQ